ncbi:hypothetical protein N7541_004667 [Penicillium brevicompactum]|uniref:Uncharacterized protein n=1 Tax=Penicillium brevicompactum TaxID=5074 RepID=A0A9W9RDX4_PENBR|nr:hypothetical protein N7541_004667 [Penicillium brevicompactum]
MQLSFQICVGVLAALSTSANGLVFHERITQDVEGTTLTLIHGVPQELDVKLDTNAYTQDKNGWEFNTEGQEDTDAVIRPIDNPATLVCKEGSTCSLDVDGSDAQVYRINKINGSTFSLQDTASSLYVSRSANLTLELTQELTETGQFTLQKISSRF